MDEPSHPTAAELGISDLEYERIMREMRRRGRDDLPEPPTVPVRRRRTRRRPFAVFGLIVLIAFLIRPGATSTKPAYAFLDTVNGRPVTYSSCHPIQVAVYPFGGPPDAEDLVREAVAQLRTATGLDIVVTGVFGGHAPNWNFAAAPVGPDDPISVSWQDGKAIAEMTDHVGGIGGSRVATGPNGTKHLGAGTIAMSRDLYAVLAQQGNHVEELALLLHEFGHVFGLAHVDSQHELMYKEYEGLTTFGTGDLEGLRLLGQGPCT